MHLVKFPRSLAGGSVSAALPSCKNTSLMKFLFSELFIDCFHVENKEEQTSSRPKTGWGFKSSPLKEQDCFEDEPHDKRTRLWLWTSPFPLCPLTCGSTFLCAVQAPLTSRMSLLVDESWHETQDVCLCGGAVRLGGDGESPSAAPLPTRQSFWLLASDKLLTPPSVLSQTPGCVYIVFPWCRVTTDKWLVSTDWSHGPNTEQNQEMDTGVRLHVGTSTSV